MSYYGKQLFHFTADIRIKYGVSWQWRPLC